MRAPLDLRGTALELFRAGLAAADGRRLLERGARLDREGRWSLELPVGRLEVSVPPRPGRVFVAGAGKAAASLAAGLEASLGARIDGGRVIVKYGHGTALERVLVEEAAHPVPDEAGVTATRRLLADVEGLGADDVVFFALTGGASALLVAPAPGLGLEEKTAVTRALLASGATIREMNAVRKHLSAVKGGRLAERVHPARIVTLVVSDVVGDDLSSIGSGPTAPDPTTYADALGVLDRYGLRGRVPPRVVAYLTRGARGELPETPKPGDPRLARVVHRILASNRVSVDAAVARALSLGVDAAVHAYDMEGHTHERARAFAAALLERAAAAPAGRPFALVAGGETTLEVRGEGRGGRNQEFALVAALGIRGREDLVVLAAGTDGTDGPTDAAGAFVDGTTIDRALAHGLDPEAILRRNDTYRLFDALGDLLRTGPTGTNVMDLVIGVGRGARAGD